MTNGARGGTVARMSRTNVPPPALASRRRVLTSVAALLPLGIPGCGPGGARTTVPDPTDPSDGTPSPPTPTPPATIPTTPTTPPTTSGTPSEPGPEPSEAWAPPGTEDLGLFACGVQTGDVLPDKVIASVRQFGEPTVDVVVAVGTETGWTEVARIDGVVADAGVAMVEVSGLLPDHTYAVVAYAPDGVRRSASSRFRTALAAAASRVVRFGATSCLGSYGAPWESLTRVAAQKLDFFVLLGDTIYADEGLAPAGDWEGHWTDALSTAGLRDLTASTSVVATWDDHEVSDGFPEEYADEGTAAFYRAMPVRLGPDGGLYRKVQWGSVADVFVLDCRSLRSGTSYLGEAQTAWLMGELAASTARFKVIANSVPITDMDDVLFGVANSDGWSEYPEARAEILDFIADNAISGVLWITGDVHWGAICTVDLPGGPHDDVIEVLCGPAGSLINPVHRAATDPDHYELVIGDWNSVVFELDPVAGTVRVVYEGDTATLGERRTTLP